MNKVFVHLESCFGIRYFEKEFDFSKTNAIVVYAPNGTMKTSFAKTLAYMAEGKRDKIEDRVSGDSGKVEISFDGKPIDTRKDDRIFVVNGDDFVDAGQSVANILTDSYSHSRYSVARKELDFAYEELIKQLREVSKDDICESALRDAFRGESIDEFQAKLADVCCCLKEKCGLDTFDHKAVFDGRGKVATFLEKNKDLINTYAKAMKRIIRRSRLFGMERDKLFAFGQAEELLKALGQGGYFEIGHKLRLKNGTLIESTMDLEKLINEQKRRLAKDVKKCKEMVVLSKRLSANAELRRFRDLLTTCPWVAGKLENYEDFRREVWRNYLNQVLPAARAYAQCFKACSERLSAITSSSRQQLAQWQEVVDEFNSRFSPSFKVSIANESDVMRHEGIPAKLSFSYLSNNVDKYLPVDTLQEILSRGEGRALRLMQVIFEIKARLRQNRESLIVFDDVVDSFDYRNKYAMVEYMKQMAESGLFKCIILTHNFDFYRLVSSRLGLKKGSCSLVVSKNKNNKISSLSKQYQNDVLQGWIESYGKKLNGQVDGARRLIAMIPFVRNMAEYMSGGNSSDSNYLQLTYCLHYRDSSCPLLSQIVDVFMQVIPVLKDREWLTRLKHQESGNYYDLLFNVAKKCCGGNNESLEHKMVLAIATRIKAEQYLLGILRGKAKGCKQFGELYEVFKKTAQEKCGTIKQEYLKRKEVLERTAIVAPEYIHVNSFMYESLIDTDVRTLVDLYKEVARWEA